MTDRWWIAIVTWTSRDLLDSPAFSIHLFDAKLRHGQVSPRNPYEYRLGGSFEQPRGATGISIGAENGILHKGNFAGQIAGVRLYRGYADSVDARRIATELKAAHLE